MLSLLSYNVFLGRKLDSIASWLIDYRPFDIMCFQEFPEDAVPELLKQWKKRSLQHEYAASFSKNGRSYGELTIYDAEKLRLTDWHIVHLGGNKLEDKIFKVKTARTALITTFASRHQPFTIANTHLVCIHLNSMKRRQLKMIVDHMNGHTYPPPHPQLVLGDFNYSSLMRQKKFMRFMEEYGFANAYRGQTHRLYYIPHQVDYIFFRHCSVENVAIENVRFSDHLPLHCTLNFSPLTSNVQH